MEKLLNRGKKQLENVSPSVVKQIPLSQCLRASAGDGLLVLSVPDF